MGIPPHFPSRNDIGIFPAAAGDMNLPYPIKGIQCDQLVKGNIEIMQLAVKIVQIKNDKTVYRFKKFIQEFTMLPDLVEAIGKSQVFQSYRATACGLYAPEPVLSNGQGGGGIRDI